MLPEEEEPQVDELEDEIIEEDSEEEQPIVGIFAPSATEASPAPRPGAKNPQGELELDGGPKGKFEGETPNFLDGEDLDVPPFLRKNRK